MNENPTEEQSTHPEEIEVEPNKRRMEKPALVINVQSIWTPILAIVMLVIGLLGGYYLRTYLSEPVAMDESSISAAATSPAVAAPTAATTAPVQPTMSSEDRKKVMEALISQTRHFRGDPNAPVTVIEFSDFQCPFCGRFASTTQLQLDEAYINPGKVRFGYVHLAFLGEESQWAAEASECASDQEKFWEYHDLLFKSQSGENQGAFSKDNLKKFAVDLGLDATAFNDCLDSGKHADLVQKDTTLGQSLGINSTPTFAVAGQPLVGAQPFEAFQKIIDQVLSGN